MQVAIIFGGVSSEHDVSCLTAQGVARAIDQDRYQVVGIGISPSGRWSQYSVSELLALKPSDSGLPRLDDSRPAATFVPGENRVEVATISGDSLRDRRPVDVVFSLLHGPFGEDGTIQGLCEIWGLPYVGSGVAASAIGMDKALMKTALANAGLPIGPYAAFTFPQWQADEAACRARLDRLSYPLFVKPARGGSSIGISKVTEPEGLAAAVAEAARWDPKIVVEEGISAAREIELAVLGTQGGEARVSVPGEIIVHTDDKFYDFDAKYLPEDQVTLAIPADLPPEILPKLAAVARRCFAAIAGEGLARVDLFLADGKVIVNEINTMPGFTKHSMFPSLWAASGVPYPELIAELIELAVSRQVGLR